MLLIDAGMIAFAAFHALKGKIRWPLAYQVPRMVRAVVGEGQPYALCWNSDRLWKRERWPPYQANRPEIWDVAGRPDYETTIELLTTLGALQFRTEGLESDEVLAAIVHRLSGHHAIVIVSDDKDFFQLLSGSVRMRGRVRGDVRWSDVRSILGVTPAFVADYLSLAGDATDGVPAVVRRGEARRLIETRGHVHDWIDRDLRIEPRLKRRIEEGREQVRMNLELVDLSREAVEARGAPGEPLLEGWGNLDRARAIGKRTGVAGVKEGNLAEAWAALREGGERAREILGVGPRAGRR